MSFCSLENQVALVTGASRGIGAAVAKRLADAGATVLINYKSNREAAEKVLASIQGKSPKSEIWGFDVSNEDETDRAFQEISKEFENLSILVCNAGISRDTLLPRTSKSLFQEVLDTNLLGTVNCVRAAARPMMKNRYGRIICVSSIIGEIGNKGQTAYAASKSALFGFCRSVALELASRQITCNVVCPGFIETDMTMQLDENLKKDYFQKIPLGRFASPDEVASCVQFLASKEAGYMTGVTLDINGGLLMR